MSEESHSQIVGRPKQKYWHCPKSANVSSSLLCFVKMMVPLLTRTSQTPCRLNRSCCQRGAWYQISCCLLQSLACIFHVDLAWFGLRFHRYSDYIPNWVCRYNWKGIICILHPGVMVTRCMHFPSTVWNTGWYPMSCWKFLPVYFFFWILFGSRDFSKSLKAVTSEFICSPRLFVVSLLTFLLMYL